MLEKRLLEELIGITGKTGADFVEVFVEKTLAKDISMIDSRVDNIVDGTSYGVGIRAYKGFSSVYGTTSDVTYTGLVKCANDVAVAIGSLNENSELNVVLTERVNPNIHKILRVPSSIGNKEKVDILKRAYFAAKDVSNDISQVAGYFLDVDRTIQIANSEGLLTSDRQIRCRLGITSVATKNSESQSGRHNIGKSMGLELFNLVEPESIGKEASRVALVNLSADYAKAGVYPVAIDNGFGGVIFHEACGHSLEATSVATKRSVFSDSLGKQIANTKVTAIDDGTIANAWGSRNIDDEGTPTQKNVLIENGILKTFMVDRLNSRRMNAEMTGSSRRENYTFEPTSRMTNTYIAPGEDSNEDIISSMEYGLYAKSMGGGSVQPTTGAFNFAVNEGYIVRNGKICEPVRGASLIGKGSEILFDIDMVGKDLDFGQGMCGSLSGSVPTDCGQPMIRVSKITVGGR